MNSKIIILCASIIAILLLGSSYPQQEGNETVYIYHTSRSDSTDHFNFRAEISTGAGDRVLEAATPYAIEFKGEPFLVTVHSLNDTIELQMAMSSRRTGAHVWGKSGVGTVYSFPPKGGIGYIAVQK